MSNILEVKNLKVQYGGIKAIDGIDFAVEEGKIVTLIGANGAGKSTSLRTISGLITPASGSVTFMGQDITGLNAELIVGKGISMCPEGRKVFPNLTVLENLKIGAYLRKDDLTGDIEYIYGLFPRLKERSWQLAGTLSGGEQQMLAVGRALMSKPKLLMMDEPSLGLAPLVVKEIFEIIKMVNESGISVLLVEQNANMALKVADVGYVLETGHIIKSGTGDDLLKDPAVIEAYLGKSK